MLFGFLFYLFITVDIVTSASLTSIKNRKSLKIRNEESLYNALQGKDIINPTNSESSIAKDIESNPLLKEIFEALPFVPTDLVRIVDGYIDHDKTIDEYFDRIINKLREITQEKITLDLYDSNFISHLLKLITDIQEKIPSFHPFWHYLARFLFKYTLSMRETFSNDNASFEESVKSINDIITIADDKIELYFSSDNLQSMTNFNLFIFKDLVKYEIFDRPKLLEIFAKNIINEEASLIMDLDQIEEIYCDGDFNNNPFLKLMLIEFAFGDLANDQMLKREWITIRNKDFRGYHNFAIALHHIYSSDKDRENKVDIIESLRMTFLSPFTIKFFLDNNLQFRISDLSDFIQFLKVIEYIGLPEEISLSKFIKLGDLDGVYKWNKDIFKEHLTEAKRENEVSEEGYDRFIKLVE